MIDPTTLPPCRHRGRPIDSERCECRSNRLILATPGVVPLAFCARPCPYADRPNAEDLAAPSGVKSLDCPHRGPILREDKCDQCGLKGQPLTVFACDLHGECSLYRMNSGIRGCNACPDRPRAESR